MILRRGFDIIERRLNGPYKRPERKHMEYREMKMQAGTERPSLLGFGCMRFPKTPEGGIDEAEAARLIDTAIQNGVNYLDTAYPYHEGASEPFMGRLLKRYDRGSFYLATKLPMWLVKSLEDAKRLFEEQMDRLQADYVDFYLLHGLNRERWETIRRLGLIAWAEGLQRSGRIRYLGFSFHDDYQVFEDILTSRKWDFCQIQYNYMDRQVQAGDRGYKLAEKLGTPVIVMEPVKGGTLAALPEDMAGMFERAAAGRSCASWAMRWVGSHPGVKVILSGMSTEEQVEDNLATFNRFEPLTDEENQVVEGVAAALRKRVNNGCTGCRYCMPCPFGVDIPQNFSIWNEGAMYGIPRQAKAAYRENLDESARAGKCQKCGKCESACPQNIAIRDDLERVEAELGA